MPAVAAGGHTWRRSHRRRFRRRELAALASVFAVALLTLTVPGVTAASATTTPPATTPPAASPSAAAPLDQSGQTSGVAAVPTLAIVLFDGDVVLVGGRGFLPGQNVKIEATTEQLGGSASMKAGGDGRVLLGFQVPAGFAGKVSVTASQGTRTASGELTVGTPTPAPTPTITPSLPAGAPETTSKLDTAGKLSGLPWMSGVHPANELQPYLDFGTWRGRQVDLAHVFTVREQGWDPIVEPNWPVNDFASFPGKLVISQPLYPEGVGNNAECATGAYNDQWKRFGAFLVSKNRADTIVRIGWEFNGWFMYWHVDPDPTNWVKCFQNVASAIRSTDPDVKIDWTFNAHGSPVPDGGTPWPAYPGDEYVDYIGIDPYDMFPPSPDEATFDRQCNDPNGLCYAAGFAREHGKKLSVGEWGVTSCSGDPGGDNPLYIKKMWEAFVANKDVMGYESYYDDPMPNNVCSTILNGGVNPNSSAEYKKLWDAGV
ncbi:glycoside hydrolase family 26 protein [Pseudofrankia asymbiotica]|uniref:glycoside hydrolase family 26 protein n=1 Tax=Pseudofrankia asymbiotica TaxID=1834516 RepID=UPI001F529B04|nr:beta-mannanase [Pseudofrankia asymbiotica]